VNRSEKGIRGDSKKNKEQRENGVDAHAKRTCMAAHAPEEDTDSLVYLRHVLRVGHAMLSTQDYLIGEDSTVHSYHFDVDAAEVDSHQRTMVSVSKPWSCWTQCCGML
jgi:hypothetical protein